ncbi:FAD-binding oxidoreductase [Niveispirillum fermenti]|uniref:FAD-binding oxidoreductase n=1 Tax=Niveispirillum fermenti TaxID=1233113 RepID=UPI003A86920C
MPIDRRNLMAGAGSLAAAVLTGPAAGATPSPPVEKLRGVVKGPVFARSDAGYPAARRGQGTTPVEDRFPALVVQPDDAADIAHALEFAQRQDMDISVRSGGHDLLGASTTRTGMLIDLSRLTGIDLDPASRIARVGAGTRAGALTNAGAPHGLVPSLGMNPNVGVGGLTLGGGMGWVSGICGATVDTLLSVDLVTADGRVLRADADSNADLFWALRGGGGNFGVATAFTYNLHAIPQVLAGDIGFKADPVRFLRFLRDFLAQSPDALEVGTLFTLGPDPTVIVRLCWSGSLGEGEKVLAALRAFGPAILDTVRPQAFASFAGSATHFDNMFLRGGEFDGITDPVIDAFAEIIAKGGPKGCLIGLLHYLHGALCRVPAGSTPFIREPGHILYNIVAPWQGADLQQDRIDWAMATSQALKAVNSRKTYINYLSYEGDHHVRDAFGPYFERLQAVKRRYDPGNIFHNNRNIRA